MARAKGRGNLGDGRVGTRLRRIARNDGAFHGGGHGSHKRASPQCLSLPKFEETRAWYEDFLGLKLVSAFPIDEGRALHTFFQMDDGSCLAFFEVPGKPFDFKRQDSLDLHIALGVDNDVFERMLQKGRARAIEVRGPVDHGFCRSIYFRDPNGYIVELTADTGILQEIMDPAQSKPHEALTRWQAEKHA